MFELVFSIFRPECECLMEYLDEHVGEFQVFSCGRNVYFAQIFQFEDSLTSCFSGVRPIGFIHVVMS